VPKIQRVRQIGFSSVSVSGCEQVIATTPSAVNGIVHTSHTSAEQHVTRASKATSLVHLF